MSANSYYAVYIGTFMQYHRCQAYNAVIHISVFTKEKTQCLLRLLQKM